MIKVNLWTTDGDEYEVETMPPSEIQPFIELIKNHGVYIDGNTYFFVEAMYHPEGKVFDITVK
jgi:hypothetical protein